MKLSNEAQEEEFKEIGVHLHQAREAKSISIDEIAINTRIRPAFLQALESGRAEDLPEAVFVQGFIRRYCEAIGIDGIPIASKFGDSFLTVEKSAEDTNIQKKSNILYIPLAVPYILLLVAASFGLFYILNPRRGSESIAQKTSLTSTISPTSSPNPTARPVETSVSVASPSDSIIPTTSPSITSSPKSPSAISTSTPTPTPRSDIDSKVEVGVELQDKSWVRVKVDGKTEFEGELSKGHKQTWTGTKEVLIRSGNAGAVLVSVNKKPPLAMGANQDVKQTIYTPELIPSATATPTP